MARPTSYDGRSLDPLYWVWSAMKNRCFNVNSADYPRYGGRGVTMYEPWIDDARACINWLRETLGDRPPGHSIDRINNDGNYEPGNLRWASGHEQALNKTHRRGVAEHVGVSRQGNKWQAAVKYQGKSIYLGLYSTIEEAAEVVDAKRLELGLPIDVSPCKDV